jgi:hypothetical protein
VRVAQPGAQTVTIRNLERRPADYEFPHAEACRDGAVCQCVSQLVGWREHDPVDGERFVRGAHRMLPKSITLLAKGSAGGDACSGLPMSVLNVEAVRRARDTGRISVTLVDVPAAPEPAAVVVEQPPVPAPAPTPPPMTTTRAKRGESQE